MAARWSDDIAACGFTSTPNVLQDHFTALGLSLLDYVLLDLIEQHRREEDRSWPSQKTLAAKAGKSTSQVERRLAAMRKRGLIEWTTERGHRARYEHNVYTRHGLTSVCDLIAANRRAGRTDEELRGVPELLATLAERALSHPAPMRGGGTVCPSPPRTHAGSPPRTHAADHPAPMRAEAEAREEDAFEEDSCYQASKRVPRPDDDLDIPDDWVAFLNEPPRAAAHIHDDIPF